MESTWRLLCSAFLVMTCLLIRDSNLLPKKELHRSLQVCINHGTWTLSNSEADVKGCWIRLWLKNVGGGSYSRVLNEAGLLGFFHEATISGSSFGVMLLVQALDGSYSRALAR